MIHFNFKPHELTRKNLEQFLLASLGNSIIKRTDKKTSRQKLSGRKFYFFAPLLSMRINC